MVGVGDKYQFYFGKDIYIPYIVWSIDREYGEDKHTLVTLLTNDTYAGCDKEMKIIIRRGGNSLLFDKPKVYNWVDCVVY